ncbi:hypothetical protein [Streptomyces sp. TRM72054]|nr:hypothetical protein [Streptomyces sp. TRM72054]
MVRPAWGEYAGTRIRTYPGSGQDLVVERGYLGASDMVGTCLE